MIHEDLPQRTSFEDQRNSDWSFTWQKMNPSKKFPLDAGSSSIVIGAEFGLRWKVIDPSGAFPVMLPQKATLKKPQTKTSGRRAHLSLGDDLPLTENCPDDRLGARRRGQGALVTVEVSGHCWQEGAEIHVG